MASQIHVTLSGMMVIVAAATVVQATPMTVVQATPIAAAQTTRVTVAQAAPDKVSTCAELAEAYRADGFSGEFRIQRQGLVECEARLGQVTGVNPRFLIGSVSKQFTAAGLMLLVEDGKVSLDEPLSAHFPEITNADRIPIHRLLNHTSGITDFTGHPVFFRLKETPFTNLSPLLALIASLPSSFEPGTRWDYSNSNYILIAALIEKLSGQTWGDFIRKRLLEPLGLKDTAFATDRTPDLVEGHVFDRDYGPEALPAAAYLERGWANGAGGLESTTRDLAAWNGALYSGKVLSAKSLREVLTPSADVTPGIHYAFGVMLRRDIGGEEVFFHSGGIPGFTSMNIHVPRRGLSVVVLGNTYDGTRTSELAWKLLRISLGEPVSPPDTREIPPPSPSDLNLIPGDYIFTRAGLTLNVRAEAGALYASFNGDREYKLLPRGPGLFFQRLYGLTLEFSADATKVILRQGDEAVEGERIHLKR